MTCLIGSRTLSRSAHNDAHQTWPGTVCCCGCAVQGEINHIAAASLPEVMLYGMFATTLTLAPCAG